MRLDHHMHPRHDQRWARMASHLGHDTLHSLNVEALLLMLGYRVKCHRGDYFDLLLFLVKAC